MSNHFQRNIFSYNVIATPNVIENKQRKTNGM